MKVSNSKIILIVIVCLAGLGCSWAVWKSHTPAPSALNITTTAGNYGLFIDNQDNEYFATKDANVRNIIKTYLTRGKDYPYELTDAEKYGERLVYYYTKENFMVAELYYWANINNIDVFSMYDTKTGQQISECSIYAQAGLYKDSDFLLSASSMDVPPNAKEGACLYERGAPNFTFIDLSSKLGATETLFSDPTGQTLKANVRNVDTQNKTFTVDVYDTINKDASGNYAYKRSIEISY